MVAIFNARMLSPIRIRSALSHNHMPTNSKATPPDPTPNGHPIGQPPRGQPPEGEPLQGQPLQGQPLQGPIRITATEAHAGQRIDRFLADSLGTISRSRVKTLIDEGRLHSDTGRVTQPAEPVRAGGIYTLDLPAPIAATPLPQSIPFPILYEDADLIVLDKPAGLVVHPAPGNLDGTLVNALLAHCGPGFTGIGAERRPGIVHRLDKDTSGVMVVAKTQLANDALTTAFATRDLDRAYIALVWGLPQPLTGEIEGAIGRDKRDRKRMAVVQHGGKASLTRYRTMRAWQTSLALLECRLATGRTHQIRVHFAGKGHPIVGDPLYLRRVPATAKAINPPLRGHLLDFPRQALHAASLGFKHPRTGLPVHFEAALPADMQALLDDIEANLSGC
jgi:23S rRNA pseudouridine1911/1915/1917 synthase